ncbi:MAG TPA: SusD/RagB family nutrient-binding outer membrane lipoprotein [Balneolales bacterium]|nr:SusD/RagB family nutrient-binding outer membrane lipoprotein [Balneolales bacterium]
MKTTKYILAILMLAGLMSCTKMLDFSGINKNPNAITADEASAKYFLTPVEYKLYAPDRYPYWRAQLIHGDRYAGYFTFGYNGSWWTGELGYKYNSGYTDATYDWLAGYFETLDNFMKLTGKNGTFANPKMYAVGQILKGLYFEKFTDTFGMIPFSQVGDPTILTPKFDTQETIYKGLIADLDSAMTTIGDATTTGQGINDIGANDVFCHGDLQLWKKLANTLKLRIALRAYGAPGNDFSTAAIKQAMGAPLLDATSGDITMEKDNIITQWNSSCYGDVWWNFGGVGSKWKVSQPLIDYLKNNNDPRLAKYATPAAGGTQTWIRPKQANDAKGYTLFPKLTNYVLQSLTDQGVPYTKTSYADSIVVTVPQNQYYVGEPVRLSGYVYNYVSEPFFSNPAADIIQQKNQGKPIFPEIVLTSAESYFMQAKAVVMGLASGNANQLYQDGITQAMKLWGVSDANIQAYLGSSASLASLTGSTTSDLQKIAIQRWIASYTDGFEGWAVVRKSGYPAVLANGVTDPDINGLGTINGDYPTRMRYGTSVQDNNGTNYQAAVSAQGPDMQNTLLWFEKK